MNLLQLQPNNDVSLIDPRKQYCCIIVLLDRYRERMWERGRVQRVQDLQDKDDICCYSEIWVVFRILFKCFFKCI